MLSVSITQEKNVKGSQKELIKRNLNKPLYKQKFYLDIKNRVTASQLETKIKELGGDVELFLVKDIKSLITDRDLTTVKTPESINQSSLNSPDTNKNDTTKPKTRADAMLAKARTQGSLSIKDPLEEAKRWKICILSVEKAFAWLNRVEISVKQSLETKKLKILELKKPFLKFEAFDRKNRPVFQEIPNWPSFNINGSIGDTAFICCSNKDFNMIRKTRVNNVKASNLVQSGYCEACRIEYSNLDDHLKSTEHQNFINDTNNFKELDDMIKDGCNVTSFLKVNGSLGRQSDRNKCPSPVKSGVGGYTNSKKMPQTRTTAVCDKRKHLSLRNDSGHNLRTRRNNSLYSTLSSGCEEEVVSKPTRELRSRTRSGIVNNSAEDSDTWSSGRPKRSCIKQKRVSADERLVFDNKTYYRVEVLSNKLRSSGAPVRGSELVKPQVNHEAETDDKGLIVKFRKMRYSELERLNDEAENFLFPRRDESSSEEDIDDDCPSSTVSTIKDESLPISSESDMQNNSIKNEEDCSMDSSCSEYSMGRKRKRRTQAEAFISDNQEYYKFEMPGSRLRYQGSYLSPLPSKNNGERLENENDTKLESNQNTKESKIDFNRLQFSFETFPKSEPWFQTFQRQDMGEQLYYCNFSDSGYWKPFILPYQLGPLPPLDPRICISAFKQKQTKEETAVNKENSESSVPSESASLKNCTDGVVSAKANSCDVLTTDSNVQQNEGAHQEQSVQNKNNFRKPRFRRKGILLPSKNPRKSPRQHASTLAILSSLIQRKKKEGKLSRSPDNSNASATLTQEKKATKVPKEPVIEEDYELVGKKIDDLLTSSLENSSNIHLSDEDSEEINFRFGMSAVDILENPFITPKVENKREKSRGNKSPLIKASPGRKNGRKKKKNRTGWPNKNRKVYKKDKEGNEFSEQESVIDSPSAAYVDSEDGEEDEVNESNTVCKRTEVVTVTDTKEQNVNSVNNNEQNEEKQGKNGLSCITKRLDVMRNEDHNAVNDCCTEVLVNNVEDNRDGVNIDLEKWESAEKLLNDRLSSDSISSDKQLQPIVRVEKLDSEETGTKRNRRVTLSPRRTNKRPRRMPASPKSPRILRKPRGRWYRERF